MVDTMSPLGRSTGVVVLVVEDDAAMRSMVCAYLRREGFDVIGEPTADRVPVLVETTAVDVAIVDKEMPGMGGLDLLSFLHQRCPDLPVIVVTAFGGRHVAQEAFERGACRYLEKPFRMADLVGALQSLTASVGCRETPPTGQ